MNRKNSAIEMPSIIQEIVFYDKPNIKTVVPEEIVPEASTVPLGKGDIVFSRIRKTSIPHTTAAIDQDGDTNSSKANDPALKDELVDNKPFSSIDSLNHFITYENVEEDLLEAVDIVQATRESNEASSRTEDKVLEAEEPSRSPKKVSRSVKQGKKSVSRESTKEDSSKSKKGKDISIAKEIWVKVIKETQPISVKESPFKKPKRPMRKAEKKTQKVTMLNFLTKTSKDEKQNSPSDQKIIDSKAVGGKKAKEKLSTKETPVEVSSKEDSPRRTSRRSDKVVPEKAGSAKEPISKNSEELKQTSSSLKNTESKKSRARPRRGVETKNNYSDEDVSFRSPEKNKNYVELTNVLLDDGDDLSETNANNLEELLNEAQEHVGALSRVEEDLQNMFKDGQGEEKKQNTKRKRKATERKAKSTAVSVKIKQEVEEEEDEESSRDVVDESVLDDYDTDGDSRSEWVPMEYAEYRQQHVMRQENKMFPCKYCFQQFTSYYSMRKHRALTHNDLGTDRKEGSYKESVKCKQEKEQDDSDEESRDEWMPQDYADYKMKHKMNKMKRVQWYKCKICCAVFSNYYKLSKHRVEHESKPNPYECKQCDDRFKDVESLMAHIRVHQGKDPYQCRKCEKGFMTKAELDEHIPVHILKKGPAPPKRFRCDICSKEFSKLCDIERHTRVHTGEKPSECNICHKRFQQSHNLSKHLLTHLHVKPFQCEICNKKFGRIDVLNRHLLTHSMEKPFKCQICNKGFIRHVQLSNHVEKVHTSSDRDFEEGVEDDK